MPETIAPVLCIYCAEMAEVRKDRNGGFYVSCTFCGTRTFFKTPKAHEGYMLTAALLEPHRLAHQQTLRVRYEALIIGKQVALQEEKQREARETRERARARRRREED